MAQVSGIEVKFSADTGNLEKGIGRAQSAISGFAKGAAASLAGALSVGVFAAAAKSAVNFADSVGKAAQKVGSTTKALSELNYAASLSDLTFSDLETGMRFLSKSMVTNAELFRQLGVSIQNSDGSMRSTDEVLMALADKFAGMPDSVQKTALAMELFGRSGTSMIPMLNAGSAGLEQMRQRADALGLSISEDTAKRAEQFNDTITDLAAVGQGAMMRLASAMLPVAKVFLNVSVAGAEAMTKLGTAIAEIAPYATIAAAAVAGFYAPALLSGLALSATAFRGIAASIYAVEVALMANPIGLIVGALAAATAAAFVFRDNIKNILGIDLVASVKNFANAFIRGFMNLKDATVGIMSNLGNIVGGAMVGVVNSFMRVITDLVNRAIGVINSAIEKINGLASYTGLTFGEIGKVAGYEFENNFSKGVDAAWKNFEQQMVARRNTDYIGSLGEMLTADTPASTTDVPTFDPGSLDLGGGDKNKSRETGTYREEDPFFIDRLDAIREQFKTEREILDEEYTLNQEVLDNALANKLLSEQEYYAMSQKLAQDHEDTLKNIRLSAISDNLGHAADFMGSMAQIAELGGKKTTKIAKAFGIAQALISTFQGAAEALKLPFPANLAAYASVLAQGMTAVASIRKVNENGGGNGGSGGGGGGGAASMAGAGGGGSAAASPTTTFSFTLMNDPMGFGEKFARQFIDQLNSTQRNGGTIRGVIA